MNQGLVGQARSLQREHAREEQKKGKERETLLPVVFISRLTLQMFRKCCQNMWNDEDWNRFLSTSWWMETQKCRECSVPSVSGTFLSFFLSRPKKGKKAHWWYSWFWERFKSLYCCTWLMRIVPPFTGNARLPTANTEWETAKFIFKTLARYKALWRAL